VRSQNSKSKTKKHILEIDFFKETATSYIDELIPIVKEVLSSPESAIFLSDVYDREHGLYNGSLEDSLIGPIVYRSEEDPLEATSYKDHMDIYYKYDIYKFFHISFYEFMDMTKIDRDIMLEKIKIYAEEKQEELRRLEEENNIQSSNLDLDDFGIDEY